MQTKSAATGAGIQVKAQNSQSSVKGVAPFQAAGASSIQRQPAAQSKPGFQGAARSSGVIQAVLWTWGGARWQPDRVTKASGPHYPGRFIGQTYDDMTGEWSEPDVVQVGPRLVQVGRGVERPLYVPMQTGMAHPRMQMEFADLVADLIPHLNRLKFDHIATAVVDMGNINLRMLGVMPINLIVTDESTVESGSFSNKTWTLKITRSRDQIDVDALANIADTIYHEMRHAEQSFRIARLLAGYGHSVRQIAQHTEIASSAIVAAHPKPLALLHHGHTPETHEALGWYHSFFGSQSGERAATLIALNTYKNLFQETQLKIAASKQVMESLKLVQDGLKFDVGMLQMEIGELDETIKESSSKSSSSKASEQPGQAIEGAQKRRQEALAEIATKKEEYRQLSLRYNALVAEIRRLQPFVKFYLDLAVQAEEYHQDDYLNLIEERDAWAVGGDVGRLIRRMK